jgi:hypothetical protein
MQYSAQLPFSSLVFAQGNTIESDYRGPGFGPRLTYPFVTNHLEAKAGDSSGRTTSSCPRVDLAPAYLGQMPRPAGPFAIYGPRLPTATLVLPEFEFQGSCDPKSRAVAFEGGTLRWN